jgi:leucyl-tRNA synthetase
VFTGAFAINPLTNKEIPIYAADYVLGAYGTGAIMAVPAHDQRDYEFARAFDLPVIQVVSKDGAPAASLDEAFVGDGIAINSDILDGLGTVEATAKILSHLESEGIGERRVSYKLRDWVFSRQRYWGEPIPIYFPVKTAGDPRKGDPHEIDYTSPIAVDESELPLKLPELEDYKPGDPAGVLMKAIEWRFFQKDGQWFARETNTMPQWAGSCWYYLRYLDPRNESEIFSQKAYDDWMPVDLYVGGSEHAVLHLLYARFWHKVLFDVGVVKDPEPFQKLVHQGMVLGMVYRYFVATDPGIIPAARAGDDKDVQADKDRGGFVHSVTGAHYEAAYLVESEIAIVDGKPTHPEHQVVLQPVAEKMSKARGNVVNPDEVIAQFGADSLRLYVMFMGPLEQVKPWQTSGLQGVRRFLDRVETQARRAEIGAELEHETAQLLHRTVKKVTGDIEDLRFNTAISAMMIYVNHLVGLKSVPLLAMEPFLRVLCPFAPHLSEELAAHLKISVKSTEGSSASCLSLAAWPEWDETLCVVDTVTLPIQVIGKVKDRLEVSRTATEAEVKDAVMCREIIRSLTESKELKKFIYVPGRICNLILG